MSKWLVFKNSHFDLKSALSHSVKAPPPPFLYAGSETQASQPELDHRHVYIQTGSNLVRSKMILSTILLKLLPVQSDSLETS